MIFSNFKTNFVLVFVLLLPFLGLGQILNTDIEAKIRLEKKDGFVAATSTAFNKTEITESLSYKFSVIKKRYIR